MAFTASDFLCERLLEWGGRPHLRISRRRHQRSHRRGCQHERQARFRSGASRRTSRLHGDSPREVHGARRGLLSNVRAGRHPSAQRFIRRQTRSRTSRRDRRPGGDHGDGRRLPTRSRLAIALQRRRKRVSDHREQSDAGAHGGRPRAAHRRGATFGHGDHRTEGRSRDARSHKTAAQAQHPPHRTRLSADASSRTMPNCDARPTSSMPARGSRSSSAPAPTARRTK